MKSPYKILYTEEALRQLEDALELIKNTVSLEKRVKIRDAILDRADQLLEYPE